jgi:hypothetical protein
LSRQPGQSPGGAKASFLGGLSREPVGDRQFAGSYRVLPRLQGLWQLAGTPSASGASAPAESSCGTPPILPRPPKSWQCGSLPPGQWCVAVGWLGGCRLPGGTGPARQAGPTAQSRCDELEIRVRRQSFWCGDRHCGAANVITVRALVIKVHRVSPLFEPQQIQWRGRVAVPLRAGGKMAEWQDGKMPRAIGAPVTI